MKSLTSATLAALVAAVASQPGPPPAAHHGFHGGGAPVNEWGGGPRCAESCYSSYFQAVTPTPSAYCGAQAGAVDGCITAACASATSDLNVFNSVSASVCNVLTACGSVGTYTYEYTTAPGSNFRPHFGQATPTWASVGAAVTITGCPWNGYDVGWGWWGPGTTGNVVVGSIGGVTATIETTLVFGGSTTVYGGATSVIGGTVTELGGTLTTLGGITTVVGGITTVIGGSTTVETEVETGTTVAGAGFSNLGTGWIYATYTTLETSTFDVGTSPTTTTGRATVAEAISGSETLLTTIGIGPTSLGAAVPTAAPGIGVKAMGVALGAVLVGAGVM